MLYRPLFLKPRFVKIRISCTDDWLFSKSSDFQNYLVAIAEKRQMTDLLQLKLTWGIVDNNKLFSTRADQSFVKQLPKIGLYLMSRVLEPTVVHVLAKTLQLSKLSIT
jgi:hypothetical protein